MSTANPGSGRPKVMRWIVAFAGLVLFGLGALDIAAEMKYSLSGQRESATITSSETGGSRKRSIDAQANVTPRAGTPFVVDIHDTLGNQHWKEGDTLELLCARIHADHLSCVADLWFDRYAVPVIMLVIGTLMVLGVWQLRRVEARTQSAAA